MRQDVLKALLMVHVTPGGAAACTLVSDDAGSEFCECGMTLDDCCEPPLCCVCSGRLGDDE